MELRASEKKEFENFNVEAVFLERQSLEELLRWPLIHMCADVWFAAGRKQFLPTEQELVQEVGSR